MFTDMDVDHMKAYGMDLSSRDDVFRNADAIYADVSSGRMPPPASGESRWTSDMCQMFQAWQNQGGPP
jgi:hypothetical protein